MNLIGRSLSAGYNGKDIIKNINFSPKEGEFTAILGANGSGKSTLLLTLARILTASSGNVFLDDKPIQTIPSKLVAQRLSFLPQGLTDVDEITVKGLVERGRYPHQTFLKSWREEDEAAVTRSLKMTETFDLSDVPIRKLSGGQRQRCWIAMLIAQESDIMLLDEPTTFLDLRYQIEIIALLKKLSTQFNHTIVAVLHDLNMAAQYADNIIFMRDGEIFKEGTVSTVFTASNIQDVFGWPVNVSFDDTSKRPFFRPHYEYG